MDGTKFLCSASAWLWLSECGGVGSSVFVFPRLQCDSAAFRIYSGADSLVLIRRLVVA